MSLLLARQTAPVVPDYADRAVGPPRVLRATMAVALMPFWAGPTEPVAAPPSVALDWLPAGPDATRAPSRAQFATFALPLRERIAPLAWEFCDPVPTRALQRAAAHPLPAFAPRPERTAPLAWEFDQAPPTRARLSTAQHPALAALDPKPERTSPLAAEYEPARPAIAVRAQMPDGAWPVFFAAPVVAPDLVTVCCDTPPRRAAMPTAEHLASALAPLQVAAPVAPTFFGGYDSGALRPRLIPQQLLGGAMPPQPERTGPLAWEFDQAPPTRALQRVGAHPSFAAPAQPERTTPLAWEFGDPVPARALSRAAAYPSFALDSKPERAAPLATCWEAEPPTRPSFRVAEQLCATGSLQPVITMGWTPEAPQRPGRALAAPARMQAFALDPKPERTAPLAWEQELQPSRVLRAQQAQDFALPVVFTLPPLPQLQEAQLRALARTIPRGDFFAIAPFQPAPQTPVDFWFSTAPQPARPTRWVDGLATPPLALPRNPLADVDIIATAAQETALLSFVVQASVMLASAAQALPLVARAVVQVAVSATATTEGELVSTAAKDVEVKA